MQIIIFIIAGAIAGCLSGLFGLGGGLIVVPALVFSFDLMHAFPGNVMHVAEGTSLAVMVVTTASSSFSHYKRGNTLFNLIKRLVPGIVIGVIVGASAAHIIPSHTLRIIFAFFLLFVTARMFLMSYWRKHNHEQIEQPPTLLSSTLISFCVGCLSGLLGIGAGSLLVPYLTFYHFKMKNIAATSATCSLPIAIFGAVSYMILGQGKINHAFMTGYVDWSAFIFIAIASMLAAPLGARLASTVNSLLLKRIFTVILLVLAINMFYSAF